MPSTPPPPSTITASAAAENHNIPTAGAGFNKNTTEPSELSIPATNTADLTEEPLDTIDTTMKLIVRSPYWGRILKGKTRRSYDPGTAGQTYRVIACQAVLSAIEGQFWGCCPHHGKRVLELKEYHFTDHYEGEWDLYMVGFSVATTYAVHNFFLLPQDQTTIDLSHKMRTQGWTYVGTTSAHSIRIDLDRMLGETLQQNESVGYRYHHVHLEILMSQVFDRETPRSRKAAIEKARTERDGASVSAPSPPHVETSPTGGRTFAATEPRPHLGHAVPSPGLVNTVPPIPSVVSNDTTWVSDNNSTVTPHENLSPGWAPSPYNASHHHYHHHPTSSSYPQAWCSPEQAQWYPANTPGMSPGGRAPVSTILPPMPPLPSSMNPAQQLLHQGYVLSGNAALAPPNMQPSGYLVPAAVLPAYSGGAPSQQAYPPTADPYVYGGVLAHYSEPPEEVQEVHSEDAEASAVGETSGHSADEKYSEDIATASFSESTAEEVGDNSLTVFA